MKRIISSIAVVAIFLAGCVFPIVDTRTPTPAPTAWEGGPPQATLEAEAIETALSVTPEPTCLIKGNISRDGRKLYHIPGMPNYLQVVVDPELGEAWFCNEQEAQEFGWVKANN